jgi:hypothetical protein
MSKRWDDPYRGRFSIHARTFRFVRNLVNRRQLARRLDDVLYVRCVGVQESSYDGIRNRHAHVEKQQRAKRSNRSGEVAWRNWTA